MHQSCCLRAYECLCLFSALFFLRWFYFFCLPLIRAVYRRMKANAASSQNISCVPLKTPAYVVLHQARAKKCWVHETCSLQTCPPSVGCSAYSYIFLCMQYLPKTWVFTPHTRRRWLLASDFCVFCWMCLINISRPFKEPSMDLSLMINGSRVNRRCGICKWLCVWCAARSLVWYHMGGLLMSWIQKRGRWIWKGFLRGCARARAHATLGISSPTDACRCSIKGDCKINHYMMLRYQWMEVWLTFDAVRSLVWLLDLLWWHVGRCDD